MEQKTNHLDLLLTKKRRKPEELYPTTQITKKAVIDNGKITQPQEERSPSSETKELSSSSELQKSTHKANELSSITNNKSTIKKNSQRLLLRGNAFDSSDSSSFNSSSQSDSSSDEGINKSIFHLFKRKNSKKYKKENESIEEGEIPNFITTYIGNERTKHITSSNKNEENENENNIKPKNAISMKSTFTISPSLSNENSKPLKDNISKIPNAVVNQTFTEIKQNVSLCPKPSKASNIANGNQMQQTPFIYNKNSLTQPKKTSIPKVLPFQSFNQPNLSNDINNNTNNNYNSIDTTEIKQDPFSPLSANNNNLNIIPKIPDAFQDYPPSLTFLKNLQTNFTIIKDKYTKINHHGLNDSKSKYYIKNSRYLNSINESLSSISSLISSSNLNDTKNILMKVFLILYSLFGIFRDDKKRDKYILEILDIISEVRIFITKINRSFSCPSDLVPVFVKMPLIVIKVIHSLLKLKEIGIKELTEIIRMNNTSAVYDFVKYYKTFCKEVDKIISVIDKRIGQNKEMEKKYNRLICDLEINPMSMEVPSCLNIAKKMVNFVIYYLRI